MDPRTLSICIGAAALAAAGFIYGAKFCKIGNHLVGIEWFLLAISSVNFMVYELNHSPINYLGLEFLDTFSRAVGLPVMTVAGLMVLTHRYRPSLTVDIVFLIVSSAATIGLLTDYMAADRKYILVILWSVFSIYLLYFAYQLYRYGKKGHAWAMVFATLSNQVIASIYDFYKIPHDETNIVFNFYTIALYVWAYLTIQTYYSYCALQRAMERRARGTPGNRQVATS